MGVEVLLLQPFSSNQWCCICLFSFPGVSLDSSLVLLLCKTLRQNQWTLWWGYPDDEWRKPRSSLWDHYKTWEIFYHKIKFTPQLLFWWSECDCAYCECEVKVLKHNKIKQSVGRSSITLHAISNKVYIHFTKINFETTNKHTRLCSSQNNVRFLYVIWVQECEYVSFMYIDIKSMYLKSSQSEN